VLNIQYRLHFTDDSERLFELHLDRQTLQLIPADANEYPSWTTLDNHRCPHCPLDAKTHPHCPAACAITDIVSVSDDQFSYTQVNVEVRTPERLVTAETTLQRAVSSLIGLALATSGCPHTAFFKPMARFHLPFASEEETIYRATSMYLLAQYFRRKQGDEADMDLSGLAEIYRNLQVVNMHMARRLRAASDKDATVNAVVILDMFAKALPYTIDESLQEIRYLFSSYLDGSL
jgi:hypothetical protein